MASLVIRLDPQCLDNPDADIRYRLLDLVAERSRGVINNDGYDYVGEGPLLILFLKVTEIEMKEEQRQQREGGRAPVQGVA